LTETFEGRQFCPSCGSRLFAVEGGEAEIKLGTLRDAPVDIAPTYELWVKRRERWLEAIPNAEQFQQDRE
jgi:hypothetical protein